MPTDRMPGAESRMSLREIWPSPSPTRPGSTELMASTRSVSAPSYTRATKPTTANASARIGKKEMNAK